MFATCVLIIIARSSGIGPSGGVVGSAACTKQEYPNKQKTATKIIIYGVYTQIKIRFHFRYYKTTNFLFWFIEKKKCFSHSHSFIYHTII